MRGPAFAAGPLIRLVCGDAARAALDVLIAVIGIGVVRDWPSGGLTDPVCSARRVRGE